MVLVGMGSAGYLQRDNKSYIPTSIIFNKDNIMEKELSQRRKDFLAKDFCRGFVEFCGISPQEIGKGSFTSKVVVGDQHRTQDNFIHAGLIATMSDHTAGYAAFTVVPENMRILTIEFKINFLKPAHGNSLFCQSEVISQGRQIIVTQSTVFDIRKTHGDRQGKMVSKSTFTMMVVDADKLK